MSYKPFVEHNRLEWFSQCILPFLWSNLWPNSGAQRPAQPVRWNALFGVDHTASRTEPDS